MYKLIKYDPNICLGKKSFSVNCILQIHAWIVIREPSCSIKFILVGKNGQIVVRIMTKQNVNSTNLNNVKWILQKPTKISCYGRWIIRNHKKTIFPQLWNGKLKIQVFKFEGYSLQTLRFRLQFLARWETTYPTPHSSLKTAKRQKQLKWLSMHTRLVLIWDSLDSTILAEGNSKISFQTEKKWS